MPMRTSSISSVTRDPHRRAWAATVGAGWTARLIGAAAQFAAIRLLTVLLGVEGFAAYAIVTGLLGWFMLADLGFGYSLQNHLSAKRVAGEDAAQAVRATATVLAGTTGALWLVLAVAGGWIGPALLDRMPVGSRDAAVAFTAYALIATGTGAASIVTRVFFAEHRGYLAHALSAGSALAGLAGLSLVVHLLPGHRLVWALVAYSLPGFLLSLAALGRAMAGKSAGPVDRTLIAALWKQARMFLLFNALAALVLYADYVILSQAVSAQAIAVYAIYAKIYALVFFAYSSILQASWPVCAEAIERGEYGLLRAQLPRAMAAGGAIVVAASLLLWMLLDPIAAALTPRDPVVLPAALIPLFALYWLLRVWCDTFGMVIMSAGRPGFMCMQVLVQAAINLALGYGGARWYGLAGFLIGSGASFLLTGAWASPLYLRRLVRRASA